MSLLELYCHVDDFWQAFAPNGSVTCCKVEHSSDDEKDKCVEVRS